LPLLVLSTGPKVRWSQQTKDSVIMQQILEKITRGMQLCKKETAGAFRCSTKNVERMVKTGELKRANKHGQPRFSVAEVCRVAQCSVEDLFK